MTHLKTLLLVLIFTFSATNISNAQSKVAHINTLELISQMPEAKTADEELKRLLSTYEAQMKSSLTDLQAKIKQYNAEAPSKTDEENAKRKVEVENIKKSIGEYDAQQQKDLEQKRANLFKPIREKIQNAINKVAKAQGIEYVLDSQLGGGVLVADGKNLLDDVKKELGIQ